MFVSEPAASMLPFAQYKKLEAETQNTEEANDCLLYTSDAADD